MSRCTVENSIRSATPFSITACSTHFALGQSLPESLNEKLPEDAKHTINLVSKLNNNMRCKPIDPNLTCSTDNTTLLVHEGTHKKKSKWSLVNVV